MTTLTNTTMSNTMRNTCTLDLGRPLTEHGNPHARIKRGVLHADSMNPECRITKTALKRVITPEVAP